YIPQEHVVFFKSIDLEKGQITTIDSIRGKQIISFADFKRHFSDIHVTDFPQEAERLKEKEQSEKLPKEVDKNITILNDANNSIKNFEQTRKAIKDKKDKIEEGIKNLTSKIKNNKEELEAQTKDLLNSIQSEINQFKNSINDLKTDVTKNSGIPSNLKNSLDQINGNIRSIQTSAEKFGTQIENYFDKMTQQPSQILDSYYKIVDDVQQPNQEINENIDIISNDLQRMNNAIQQKNYNQLLDDKTTLHSIKQRIQKLQESEIALAKGIESKANQLNGDIQQFTTTRTKDIESLKRQKTGLQESIAQTNSNLKQLTGENSDFKKLDNFITTERKYKADLAEQIKKDIDNIEDKNKTLKAATDENVEKMNAELDNVNSQKESYCNQITEWESILDTLESAKKNLAKLKGNKQITPQLTKKIDDNLSKLDNIKEGFDSQIKEQIKEENKTLTEKDEIINNQRLRIDSFKELKEGFENRMNECVKILKNEQDKLKAIDEQIEQLNNDKTNFEESMQKNTETLKDEQNKLKTIGQQIERLENNKKEFEESMQKNTKTLEDKQNELKAIDEQINQLNQRCQQLEKKIQQAIAEKYNLTSNKIKKCGIGVSVVGGVGTISVLVIPSVNIVFIAVPSPFALLGIILVGIYLYRNNKKPPRETIIITAVDNDSKKSINKTMKKVVEQQKDLGDQTGKISDIETKLVIDRKD
ncbi:MAG: hypothetical protein IJU86_04050, partial [Firmicutes bacterium]|nr:hypothetical protein [Bacillota bacterium]